VSGQVHAAADLLSEKCLLIFAGRKYVGGFSEKSVYLLKRKSQFLCWKPSCGLAVSHFADFTANAFWEM
jgi:hypothetical protein